MSREDNVGIDTANKISIVDAIEGFNLCVCIICIRPFLWCYKL